MEIASGEERGSYPNYTSRPNYSLTHHKSADQLNSERKSNWTIMELNDFSKPFTYLHASIG